VTLPVVTVTVSGPAGTLGASTLSWPGDDAELDRLAAARATIPNLTEPWYC
jgi:hypothetical protein